MSMKNCCKTKISSCILEGKNVIISKVSKMKLTYFQNTLNYNKTVLSGRCKSSNKGIACNL